MKLKLKPAWAVRGMVWMTALCGPFAIATTYVMGGWIWFSIIVSTLGAAAIGLLAGEILCVPYMVPKQQGKKVS